MVGVMMREPLLITGVTVSATLADCTAINKQYYAAGNVQLPAATDITTIAVWSSHDGGVTWGYAQVGGTNMTFTVAPEAGAKIMCALPDDILKYHLIKLQAQVGATAVTTASVEFTS